MAIKRNIFLTKKQLFQHIDIVYGSEIPIELSIVDASFSETAISNTVTKENTDGNVYEIPSEIIDNTIIIHTVAGAFLPGKNTLQCSIIDNGSTIISFQIPVICEKNILSDDPIAEIEAAATYAQKALKYANKAGASEKQASEYAQNALVYSNQASTNAQSAEQSKISAENAKNNAESAANNAKSSEIVSANKASEAISAKQAAENAQTNAESAKEEAISAKNDVLSAKTEVLNNLQLTVTAKEEAISAKNLAISAKNEAVSAKTASETAKDSAVKAKEYAESAKTLAQTASNSATESANVATAQAQIAATKAAEIQAASKQINANTSDIEDLKIIVTPYMTDDAVLGIQVDYQNKSFTRLCNAFGRSPGADFNQFPMFGNRKRCNVLDDGTIAAWEGDEGYKEDGSNGQVMVYQPAFWYKVVPLKIERQNDGIGYHLRKANYFVTAGKKDGFKLHPAFYDENGAEIDHIFLSAFEGSVFDVSANAYLLHDEQVADFSNDLFCSIAGARPASGSSQNLTRVNIEQMGKNRGAGWHGDTIKAEAANQLLMIIEMGTMNLQAAIGQGVVTLPWSTGSDGTSSYAAVTGATSSLGNGTGRATTTTTYEGGVPVEYTVDGKTSVTYRGMENPWGNLWKFFYDVSFWGDGSLKGGVPYICKDFNFSENKKNGNYESAGFTLTNANGYISAVGYGNPDYDWLFFASECSGNSSLPVGDYTYISPNLNGFRIARLGGRWTVGGNAGAFYLAAGNGVGDRDRGIGGRLVYIPKAKAA